MGNKQKFLKINNSEENDLQNFGNKPVPVAGLPTTADEQSISLRCLWNKRMKSRPHLRKGKSIPPK